MELKSEIIKTEIINNTEVTIVGCYDENTEEGCYDFYDIYIDSDCINEGEPFYTYPLTKDIKYFLNKWKTK